MPSRGRKPNPSVPPTRLLTQQRQFRARKAQLVQDLEQRCRTLEEENVQLRRELDVLAGPPCEEPSPQLMETSSEVMRTLADAAASIARWQQAVGVPLPSHDQGASPPVDGPRSCSPLIAMEIDNNPSTLAPVIRQHPHDVHSTTAPSHEPLSTSTSGPQNAHRPWSTPPVTCPPPSSHSTTSSMLGSFSVVTAESFERGRSGSRECDCSTNSTANTTCKS